MSLTSNLIRLMECDQCRRKFDLPAGGICSRCRRLLCNRHLHGWFQAWRIFKTGGPLCVDCRNTKGKIPLR